MTDNDKSVVKAEAIGDTQQGPIMREDIARILGNVNASDDLPTCYYDSLPKPVKRRVKALKNLLKKAVYIEAAFYQEVHVLEEKYAELYKPLFERRSSIVRGEIEPDEEECEWPSDTEDVVEEMSDVNLEDKSKEENSVVTKGIPHFWLTLMKNVELLNDMIQDHDDAILKHLVDLRCVTFPEGFRLEFVFESNSYFTDKVLVKEYRMKLAPSEDDCLSYDGPEITDCTGCEIHWKEGKNVTEKKVTKRQKHKGRGTVRNVVKTVPQDSFFSFFNPPTVDEDDKDSDDDMSEVLAADFEIGHFIRDRVIPRAVLYFTGEIMDDDDDEDDEYMDDDDDDDENEEIITEAMPEGRNPETCNQQ